MNADNQISESVSDPFPLREHVRQPESASADALADPNLGLAGLPETKENIGDANGDPAVTSAVDTVIISPAEPTLSSISANSQTNDVLLSQPIAKALAQLLRAYHYSDDCQRSRWDFAVEIKELRGSGISSDELRWLIGKNLLDHAEESSANGQTKRTFASPGGFSLTKRSCFVLTDEGLHFASQRSA